MTNFNFKFLGAWLVIVASITGLQAQNDSTLKGKDEMVPAGVWNDVNGEYINAHGGGILLFDSKYYWFGEPSGKGILYGSGSNLLLFYRFM